MNAGYIGSTISRTPVRSRHDTPARAPRQGDVFKGTVKTVHEYGCLVELLRNQQGLLHVSNMSSAVPAPAARDIVNVGDTVAVRVVEVDR